MSNELKNIIISEIEASDKAGISLERYMELCLSHEKYGYYIKNDPFGGAGDFITAPEISQIFGDLIGGFLVQNWVRMGRPENFALVELGPGRGTLMADIIRTASKALPTFVAAAKINLVERSPTLIEKQKNTLKDIAVKWHSSIDDLPTDIPIILVANEFFDALPIKQYVFRNGKLYERLVAYDIESEEFFIKETDTASDIEVPANIKEGDIYEISPISIKIMQNLCDILKKQCGMMLIIDYGYVSQGFGDSLQSVYKHKKTNIFDNIGEQDLTAHVNFEELKKIAIRAEVQVTGPITQVEFLKSLGIEQYTEQLSKKATEEQKKELASAYHRLTSAFEMGYLFKVLGVSY